MEKKAAVKATGRLESVRLANRMALARKKTLSNSPENNG